MEINMGVAVRQRVKGKGEPWWVFVNYQGKRRSFKVGNKEAAEAVADKIRAQLAAGALKLIPDEATPTLADYFQKWIESQHHLKYSTVKSYKQLFEKNLSTLAPLPMDTITRGQLKDLLNEKHKAGLARNTVRNITRLISNVLNHAVEDGLIAANPTPRLKTIRGKKQKEEINPLTREEARLFLETIEKNFPWYYPFFLCALRTGMRLGELLALEWGDLDFHKGFIEVRRSYSLTGKRTTSTKTGKIRRVDMSPQLSLILRTLQAERRRLALERRQGAMPDIVFIRREWQRINSFNLRDRVFHRALSKAGLRRIRMHDLRHTFASLLIQNNESLVYVKDQLGHSSIRTTVDIYGHLVPGAHREAVAKLDNGKNTYG
jgi:integrase